MAIPFTVLGGGGFIGGQLVRFLRDSGTPVEAPQRLPSEAYFQQLCGRKLGHVIYCIGLTSDFREKPFETVDAHVGTLARVLAECDFETLTYLSSTRIYIHSRATDESTPLQVEPGTPEDLFNLSKLTGESLCLTSGRPCRIARLSNVYGEMDASQNFLTSVLHDAARTNKVTIGLSPQSKKDYVDVRDAVAWLAKIALAGKERIYNVASGHNTSNAEIANALSKLGVDVVFAPNGKTIAFPRIDIRRLLGEFGGTGSNLLERIPDLFAAVKQST